MASPSAPSMHVPDMCAEEIRVEENASRRANWSRWGTYLSGRQWGTVREDYSAEDSCWTYLSHDDARSRAYRWGEDGLLGLTDRECRLCFGLALWNGKDPILKERLFGLTGPEGNHGEDVKESYFYLNNTPTHSYARALYKYPQCEYPYKRLIDENRARGRNDRECELEDLGVFDGERYWDVYVEYAKAGPDDIVMRVTLCNRNEDTDATATLHFLPNLWCRNTWSWGTDVADEDWGKASMVQSGDSSVNITHKSLGSFEFLAQTTPREWLFTENETNAPRLFGTPPPAQPAYYKDAFHAYVVHGEARAVNPKREGTKCAPYYVVSLSGGQQCEFLFRLRRVAASEHPIPPFADAASVIARRIVEHDEFFAKKMSPKLTEAERNVFIQAAAGLLWSKQFYYYVVKHHLEGDSAQPKPPSSRARNVGWKQHFHARDIISMPDNWEYPWLAAWDLAFHCVAIAEFDVHFAKSQLLLLMREWYMHPSGALPAYEFAFDDANPPVHAHAVWRVYRKTQELGAPDLKFLASAFHKLLLNWSWWVNRKDVEGNNVFGGGFLGLDNISIFDRSAAALPTGGTLQQADGTAWMAFFCNHMFKIAIELAHHDMAFEDISSKFFEHFIAIADAMNRFGGTGLWDEKTGFYYDQLQTPEGQRMVLRVRSMVGLVPLFSVINFSVHDMCDFPGLAKRTEWFLRNRKDLSESVSLMSHHIRKLCLTLPDAGPNLKRHLEKAGEHARRAHSKLHLDPPLASAARSVSVGASLTDELGDHSHEHVEGDTQELYQFAIPSREKLLSMLRHVADPAEFLSPYGIRSLSRYHESNPYIFHVTPTHSLRDYTPGESTSGMFGGNSNWRGPIWFPVNYLLAESLERFSNFYADEMMVEYPRGSGVQRNLAHISRDLWGRMCSLFLPQEGDSHRPCNGGNALFLKPHWRDLVLFHEYFHPESGRGCGASHQTGWTGLVVVALNRVGNRRP